MLPVGGREDHDTVLDGERVEVVDHHVVGLGQQGRLARQWSVLGNFRVRYFILQTRRLQH